jgi:hypothetical protein
MTSRAVAWLTPETLQLPGPPGGATGKVLWVSTLGWKGARVAKPDHPEPIIDPLTIPPKLGIAVPVGFVVGKILIAAE